MEVRGKPVMDHLVERMLAGGCNRLRVVTRSEKADVIAHAGDLGAEVVLARPETVSASFLAGMTGLADDDIVLVDFPDTLWEPRDGFARLVAAIEDGCEVALGLFRIDPVYETDATSAGSSYRGVGSTSARPRRSSACGSLPDSRSAVYSATRGISR